MDYLFKTSSEQLINMYIMIILSNVDSPGAIDASALGHKLSDRVDTRAGMRGPYNISSTGDG